MVAVDNWSMVSKDKQWCILKFWDYQLWVSMGLCGLCRPLQSPEVLVDLAEFDWLMLLTTSNEMIGIKKPNLLKILIFANHLLNN